MSLYSELIEAGIPTSNYYSDLYFPITDRSQHILDRFPTEKSIATTFINQVQGGRWCDVPFAYLPYYWERLEEKSA